VPRSGRRRGDASRALESLEMPESFGPNLKNLVEMYGLPRAVVDEAVAGLAAAPPPANSQARGATAMDQVRRQKFNERFYKRLLARRPNDQAKIQADFEELQKRHKQRSAQPEAAFEDL